MQSGSGGDWAPATGAQLADELAIRALVARYADAVNRVSAEDWGATWTAEGEWRLLGQVVRGREALVNFWQAAMGTFRWVFQLVHSGEVQFPAEAGGAAAGQGGRARARWYLSEVGETGGGERVFTVGVYHDDLLLTPHGWRFAIRRFAPLYQGPPDLTGRNFPFPGASERG